MLGWRKLSAWGLIFALGAYVAVVSVAHGGSDVPDNVVEMIKWVTGFFFGANAVVHIAQNVKISGKE